MGLDQWGKMRNPETGEVNEIAYWRKHNALHGWMEERWRSQGGTGEFNCVPFELKESDLDDLEKAVCERALPETQGFFFGSDSRWDEQKDKATLEFVKTARNALAEGMEIAYDSWW
mgnify:CR=1 FL=1